MIRDFLSHPVTKEILAGPKAFNSSGTLEATVIFFLLLALAKEIDLLSLY